MSDEKTYRTSGFHTDGRGGYIYRFWIMSPAWHKDGYQIKEFERGVNCACTSRIADALSEKDALAKMAQLERDARAIHKLVTPEEEHELGPDFQQAQYFSNEHQAVVAEKTYQRLKSRQPGKDFRPR